MAAGKNNSVLVVDDNPSVRVAITHYLSKAGFVVSCAEDGIKGLAQCQAQQPDLIISDIMMPEMDGIEFCKQVRQLPHLCSIPFIFLTARSETDQKILGLRSGADDYLVKPLDMGELSTRVSNLINKAHKFSEPQGLAGRLEDMGLADLLQMLEVSQKQGRLHLRHSDGRQALIALHGGILLGAQIDAGLHGEDAFFELLGWTEASFRFEPGNQVEGEVKKSITYLLMEGMRLRDERNELQQFLPQAGRCYGLAAGITAPSTAGEGEAPGILQLLAAGPKTCEQLVATTSRGTMRTESALAKLIRVGSVVPAPFTSEKPVSKHSLGVMLAYSSEVPIATFLQTLGQAFDLPRHKTASLGIADYINIVLDGIPLQLFVLRGERRFSTLWKMVKDRTSKAIFLIDGSAEGRSAAQYFSQQYALDTDQTPLVCSLLTSPEGAAEYNPESVDDIKQLLRQLIT